MYSTQNTNRHFGDIASAKSYALVNPPADAYDASRAYFARYDTGEIIGCNVANLAQTKHGLVGMPFEQVLHAEVLRICGLTGAQRQQQFGVIINQDLDVCDVPTKSAAQQAEFDQVAANNAAALAAAQVKAANDQAALAQQKSDSAATQMYNNEISMLCSQVGNAVTQDAENAGCSPADGERAADAAIADVKKAASNASLSAPSGLQGLDIQQYSFEKTQKVAQGIINAPLAYFNKYIPVVKNPDTPNPTVGPSEPVAPEQVPSDALKVIQDSATAAAQVGGFTVTLSVQAALKAYNDALTQHTDPDESYSIFNTVNINAKNGVYNKGKITTTGPTNKPVIQTPEVPAPETPSKMQGTITLIETDIKKYWWIGGIAIGGLLLMSHAGGGKKKKK